MKSVHAVLFLASLALVACSEVTNDPAVGGPDAAPGADAGDLATGCGAGSELVYVVDSDYNLISFDPREVGSGDPFSVIGQLDCPAGAAWPDVGGADATPFSMSVDRSGTAWVLYSSGELFKVSTTNAACTASNFQPGQKGFELFGMGFVSDASGSDTETLYVAGGSAAMLSAGDLATIDTGSLALDSVGSLSGEQNPEMTGTGEGELYGYFPGLFSQFIAKLDKSSGAVIEQWDLAAPSGAVSAWAFAHWGGKFYMFITTQGLVGGVTSQVKIYDPATGQESVGVSDSPYRVVGAGVSTCAPTVVQ